MSTYNNLMLVLNDLETVIELAKQNENASKYSEEIKGAEVFARELYKRIVSLYGSNEQA